MRGATRYAGGALAAPLILICALEACGGSTPVPAADRRAAIDIASTLRPTAGGTANPSWRVLSQMSAHHMLVLKVEAERVDDARRIALALCEPLKDRYAEMLVYFYRRPRTGVLAARRVQWTLESGYVEVDYERN